MLFSPGLSPNPILKSFCNKLVSAYRREKNCTQNTLAFCLVTTLNSSRSKLKLRKMYYLVIMSKVNQQ